jgi:hypothetical protein
MCQSITSSPVHSSRHPDRRSPAETSESRMRENDWSWIIDSTLQFNDDHAKRFSRISSIPVPSVPVMRLEPAAEASDGR